jgi:uncharacterized protein YdaU (DUF1376 family)
MKKSFPFYYEDYIAGTAFLSRREKGAYFDLLCCQADKGRLSLQNIKDILNGDFDCWEKIKSKFIEENGLFYNKKMESVRQIKHKRSDEEIQKNREKIEQQLKENKTQFYFSCSPYVNKYPKQMLRKFYDYWTELNKSGTKMRFELQQTFEISKRLATWANKDNDVNKTLFQNEITYKELLSKFNKGEIDVWEKYEQIIPGDTKSLWKLKDKSIKTS